MRGAGTGEENGGEWGERNRKQTHTGSTGNEKTVSLGLFCWEREREGETRRSCSAPESRLCAPRCSGGERTV